MNYCSHCGTRNQAENEFCSKCRAVNEGCCAICGNISPIQRELCSTCGARLDTVAPLFDAAPSYEVKHQKEARYNLRLLLSDAAQRDEVKHVSSARPARMPTARDAESRDKRTPRPVHDTPASYAPIPLNLAFEPAIPAQSKRANPRVHSLSLTHSLDGFNRALGLVVIFLVLLVGWSKLPVASNTISVRLDASLSLLIVLISVVLFAQSLFSLYLMLYTWEHPMRLEGSRGPNTFVPPHHTFTVLLPARHEEAVIHDTIMRVWRANYPTNLLEIVVICHADDTGTILEAQRAIQAIGAPKVRVETFTDSPINKPHGLNVGLQRTSHEVVAIFDSEDDIDPDIFQVINTVMCQEHVGIVQAGVQLMNYRDHWFSMLNCLEYYFWFKSRLHFHAQVGVIPLGGNTVFIRRDLLTRVGGWDERCLTEDAEIGLRLSVLGQSIRVLYDAQHVTREETPDTVESFIKQRTRWHQGFLQVLKKGVWRSLPRMSQRLLAIYTLTYPLFQALLMLLWPPTVIAVLWFKLSVLVALLSFLPLYALLFQFLASVVGAYMFTRDYQVRFPILLPIHMAVSFLPFQFLLGISAIRAVYRELRNQQNWEKTAHLGAHREVSLNTLGRALQWETFFDEVHQTLGAERASVMNWNPTTNRFALTAGRGLAPDRQGTHVNSRVSVVEWVAEHRRPIAINGHRLPEELQRRLRQPGLQSAIVVPIQQQDRTVTVVSVSSNLIELGDDAMYWLISHLTQMLQNQGSATGHLTVQAA